MSESSSTDRVAEPQFRRFSDKVMWMFFSGLVMAICAIWGLTWRATDNRTTEAIRGVIELDNVQKRHSDRIIRLETMQDSNEKQLKSINDKQSHTDRKIDAIQKSVNDVLLELRTRK